MTTLPLLSWTTSAPSFGVTIMSACKQKSKQWFPVTPTHSSGSHTEEEGADTTELDVEDATKDASNLLINNNHCKAKKSYQLQSSKATLSPDDVQDSLMLG
jgi:hypothetical protein